ncbi:hypothetical protein PMAYCL1PPCAC_09432, partial [Pristionchus mayeri]
PTTTPTTTTTTASPTTTTTSTTSTTTTTTLAPTTTTTTTTMRCKMCAQTLILKTSAGDGAHDFANDLTDATGACAVRSFICQGTSANIELNGGVGVIVDGDDGAVDGTATLEVTCNAAGTAWEFNGAPITQVECASA